MAYNQSKNPFYTDDKEDFGFSDTSNRGYGYSTTSTSQSDPFASDDGFGGRPLTKYDQLQQRKENSMNNQLESTQRALASICDSEQMGVTTADELVQQGEQLDNVETKLDTINQDMKTSQKHLNSIKSVFGGIKNWWHGKDKTGESSQPQQTKSQSSAGLQKALDESINAGAQSGPHPAFRLKSDDGHQLYDEDDDLDSKFLGAGSRRYDQDNSGTRGGAAATRTAPPQAPALQQKQEFSSGFGAADDQFNENLDLMCSGMERLKGLATGLGGEIERQNVQVDRITGKADRADIKLSDQNRQMRKILR